MRPPPYKDGEQLQRSGFGPCFFLSYAHTPRVFESTPDPDYFVKKFYRDLCMELVNFDQRWHTGGEPGFMDDAMQNGAVWRRQLADRLACCRVFIPLYSRAYFSKEFCGREWALFRERQMAHLAQTGVPNEAIVPVLWQPLAPEEMPAAASAVQLAPLVENPRYLERGLFELIRLDKRAYLEVVIRLAEHLDGIARSGPPPPGPLIELNEVSPLFPAPPDVETPIRTLRISVAALDEGSLPADRDARFYGRHAEDWNPYYPDTHVPLLHRVEELVRQLGFMPVIEPLGWTRDDEAGPVAPNPTEGPGIILIDPWMAQDPVGAARIAELDRRRGPWVRALVLWSRSDEQTSKNAARLQAKLHEFMPRAMDSWLRTARAVTRDLGSPADLGHTLPSILDLAWSQFAKATQARTTLPHYPPRPRLYDQPHAGAPASPDEGNPQGGSH